MYEKAVFAAFFDTFIIVLQNLRFLFPPVAMCTEKDQKKTVLVKM